MRYQLVIFDMDGTLTEELLDFDAIRADIGLQPAQPILEQIAHLPPPEQQRAQQILARHELQAAENCRIHDGAKELLAQLGQRGIKTAVLTRNSPQCAHAILQRHELAGYFSHVATRDDKPYKPHPDAILNIVRRLGVPASQTLMVGDYLYDMQAATSAGVDSALLLLNDGRPRPAFAQQATYVVGSLAQILGLVT